MRTVYNLFENERNINFGSAEICDQSLSEFFTDMDKLRLKYSLNSENTWVIAFCSKKMLANLNIKEISEKVICIDSTGGMDRSGGHIFS